MAPILSFTAEEIRQHLPDALKGSEPTVFCLRPAYEPERVLTEDELAEVSGGYGALGTFFLLDGFKALPVVLSKFLSFWFNW